MRSLHPFARPLLATCLGLFGPAWAAATITLSPGDNTVSTSRLELDFGAPNVERVDSVQWVNSDGILGANLVAAGGAPPACTTDDVLEAWGQAYGSTHPHRPVLVAAGATGTWTVKGQRTVEIESSVPFDCFSDGPTSVRTRYTFFDDGPAASQLRIERRFDFGPGSPGYTTEGLRPYVVRLSSASQMLFPDATGTALVTAGTSAEGTITDDWDGTWLALDNPNHAGVVILRDPANASPAKLILDYDSLSGSYLSSVDLTRPGDGWKEPLTEIEYLCFYDAQSWPPAERAPGVLPAGCTGSSVPINTSPPTIDGGAEVDGELTASPGTWDFATDLFAHQWLRCDGDACETIAGAEAASYTPLDADVGKTLRVEVTAISPDGETETASATSEVVTPGLCSGGLCQVDDEELFRAATDAMVVTGVGADGLPLPLPDLGAVKRQVTLGAVKLKAKGLFVGAGGDPSVTDGDWSALLPGPDIALTGKRKKKLELRFSAPIFSAGFEFVEIETGPNVGPEFDDATFTLKVKRGRKTIAETVFNAPNDVVAFVGLWSDQLFDRMEIRSGDAAGTKLLGKIQAGYIPGFSRRRNILVVSPDGVGGTQGRGALHEVRFGDGFRTLLQNFSDGSQGALGEEPVSVAVAGDVAMVLDILAGTGGAAALFRVDLRTGIRTVLSDFGNAGQGPLGSNPSDVAIEPSGAVLVVDQDSGSGIRGQLFRVDPVTGARTIVNDFGSGTKRGQEPGQLALEASGDVLVSDSGATFSASGYGVIFRVNGKNGNRTVLTDFSTASQGPTTSFPWSVAVEPSGQILLLDQIDRRIFRVHPSTGVRTVLTDLTNGLQGTTGPVRDIGVEASGRIVALVSGEGLAALVHVHPLTGYRTLFTDMNPYNGPPMLEPSGIAIRR
jgi:hypothetical protein